MPGVTLALVPKCPMCLAGYVAAASGLGISVAAAATLQPVIIGGCIALWLGMAVRLALRWQHRRRERQAAGG